MDRALLNYSNCYDVTTIRATCFYRMRHPRRRTLSLSLSLYIYIYIYKKIEVPNGPPCSPNLVSPYLDNFNKRCQMVAIITLKRCKLRIVK